MDSIKAGGFHADYDVFELMVCLEDITETVKFYIGQIQNRTDCRRQLTEELFRYSVIVSSWQGVCEETVLNRILEESLLACYGEFTQKGIEPVIDAE